MHIIRKSATLLVTIGLAATGFLGTTTAFADAPTGDGVSTAHVNESVQGGKWLPWDSNNITTMAKCEARLAQLRKDYKFLNTSNSKCTRVAIAQCPPKSVYWVMVLDHAAGAKKVAPVEQKELALAC